MALYRFLLYAVTVTVAHSFRVMQPMRMMSEVVTKSGFTVSWEKNVADGIRHRLRSKMDDRRPFMIGVVGNPGSGKSVSSLILSDLLADVGCVVMPHDGYHITMADLKALENSEDAIYRRGAPDTFNPASLKVDLQRICNGEESDVCIPGFDHARGDPDEDAYCFVRDEHRIVLCEGLYLLHDQDGWEGVDNFFDLTIFVEADVEGCVERLKIRNQSIPGYTKEEIERRCEVVDRTNAMIVERSKARADLVVASAASVKPSKDTVEVVEYSTSNEQAGERMVEVPVQV